MSDTQTVTTATGANRGTGLEVCRQLAGHGYAVALGSRDLSEGRRPAAPLKGAVNVIPYRLDVADGDRVNAAASFVAERFGRCDALVNNAAIGQIALTRIPAERNSGSTAAEMGGKVVRGVTLRDDGPTGGFFRDGRPLRW